MDFLDCRSWSRCRTCPHFVNARCELEDAVNEYEIGLSPRAAPAIPVGLAWQAPEEARASA